MTNMQETLKNMQAMLCDLIDTPGFPESLIKEHGKDYGLTLKAFKEAFAGGSLSLSLSFTKDGAVTAVSAADQEDDEDSQEESGEDEDQGSDSDKDE